MMDDLVSLDAIRSAAQRIAPYIVRTPVVPMVPGGVGLKAESLQPVGAFKIRGAFNAILSLSPEERARGVIAHSSGNHAQAVAYAAHRLGLRAVIVMPDNAPAVKLAATKRWGAEVHLVDFMGSARYDTCAALAREHGYVVVEPFDSRAIIAGAGTIGLEILAQHPEATTVYVPVSGGGLISGVAAAIKQSHSDIRVTGVEPELANDAQRSLRAGEIVRLPPQETGRTMADGLRVSQVGKIPWDHIRMFVEEIITVSEAQIADAMRRIALEARLVAEPSGAVAAAGALAHSPEPGRAVAIVSGGNVDPAFYASVLADPANRRSAERSAALGVTIAMGRTKAASNPAQRPGAKGSAKLAVPPGTLSMEARLVDQLPTEPGWQFEPKWDGFRCLAFKAGPDVVLQAKSGKPLTRYFPEVAESVRGAPRDRFVIDGELAIPRGDSLSFDDLQLRLHPAESRIRKLAGETPAIYILFDCLLGNDNHNLLEAPLTQRREALEALYPKLAGDRTFRLSPYTRMVAEARKWLHHTHGELDGVVAKRIDGPYIPGEREMLKIKCLRTADCVIGGFRYAQGTREVGSLLLGLYNEEGKLDHVGFTSTIALADRVTLTRKLEKIRKAPGFSGNAPGGPSRWSTERTGEWEPLDPKLVVEVRYDHVTGERFRHGTKLLRWRPDKSPRQCTFEQLQAEARPSTLVTHVLGR